MAALPLFKDIGELHAQVHNGCRQCVELHNGGKEEEAKGLHRQLAEIRGRFLTKLDELYQA